MKSKTVYHLEWSDLEPTQRLDRTIMLQNHRFRVLKDRIRMHTGRETIHWKMDYEFEGVGVVPILRDGRVLLGLHYRYCAEKWGWEIAAGGMQEDEDQITAAQRELEEETGYRAGQLDFILKYHPAPGLGNETFYVYFARDLQETTGKFDVEEIYKLKSFTWAEIEELIAHGQIIDGFTLTSLYCARARGAI